MTESEIQRKVLDYLATVPRIVFWRNNNSPVFDSYTQRRRALPKYTPKGLPDIFVVCDGGRLIALEVKRPTGSDDEREANGRKVRGGKLSLEQAEFAAKLALVGATFHVVRSVQDAKNVFPL